jgi:alkylation response protein AidB-like acyl-CoA dehydrogenase
MKSRSDLPKDEAVSVIDTSKMSAGQRAALELTESARETALGSFASGLFMGRFAFSRIYPYPGQSAEENAKGDALLAKLEPFLHAKVDPDEIDRTGDIPQSVIDELAAMGLFGVKIPTELGGLGLTQTNYGRAIMMLGSWCGSLTALVSAHQSIGVSQPIMMFGNEDQKRRFLPRVARGEISAFALTEPHAGSDPAALTTRAEPSADGSHYILNGLKLWCTNGSKAGVIVVMAETPPKIDKGKSRKQITAFIVDIDSAGLKVHERSHFMGLRALYNCIITFKDVKVPRENVLLSEGKGLRVALTVLNTGRLTIPASCIGVAKRCLQISNKWASERVQWGAPIARHAAIAGKLAEMTANTFAMEAMTFLTSGLVDVNKNADLRVESAMCKLFTTEMAWKIADDALQIRGGRGYETAQSLVARGEEPIGIERILRDARINRIFEGSTEIMYLFIAREALDPHLKVGGALVNSQLPWSVRLKSALKAGLFYAGWYPRQWLPLNEPDTDGMHPVLAKHSRIMAGLTRRLSRNLFHQMAWFGPKLEKRQLLLARLVNIATEIFASAASCSYAQFLLNQGRPEDELLPVVDYFCNTSQRRIDHFFLDTRCNHDDSGYHMAQKRLNDGGYSFLKDGIVRK